MLVPDRFFSRHIWSPAGCQLAFCRNKQRCQECSVEKVPGHKKNHDIVCQRRKNVFPKYEAERRKPPGFSKPSPSPPDTGRHALYRFK
jgi:hypothetical protein